MPVLSLVLIVHREQGHLEDFAASLAGQDLTDVEVLAVDDASPDHAPELLDALARREPHVRVIHLPERAGLAAARDLALREAQGEYVWFAEPTDLLAPGAVATVVAELRASNPDVLVVGHRRLDRIGRERAVVEPAREPAVGDVARRAYDKVLRVEHLRALRIRFGPGAYGELPVTWPALLAANRIAGLPDVLYVRREPGNAIPEGEPADVFAQYEAVFAFADARPDVPAERRRQVLPAWAPRDSLRASADSTVAWAQSSRKSSSSASPRSVL
jgi:CDP-glycerol glycerophosphotransferase